MTTYLTDGKYRAYASKIVVSGNDVHVIGAESNGSYFILKHWKNGIATSLTNGPYNAYASSIFVLGADVYIAGAELNSAATTEAKYWKNDVEISLSDKNATNAWANDIYVSGKALYIPVVPI